MQPSSPTQCWFSPNNNPPQILLILLKQQIRAATSDGKISTAYLPPFLRKMKYIPLNSGLFDYVCLCVEREMYRVRKFCVHSVQFASVSHRFSCFYFGGRCITFSEGHSSLFQSLWQLLQTYANFYF